MILDIIVAFLLIVGALFFLVAAIGTARFPDLYTRMHTATKGSAFAAVLMMLAVAVFFADFWVAFEVLLIIIFLFLTAPVAGHMLGRAGHILNTPLFEGTILDELRKAREEGTLDHEHDGDDTPYCG
ncbi:MAG: monovalent cation/H(+) antiporter subunit G [Bacteroidetes bacterium]|nr:monovalent cation/H(+) antiporter subunit G [Bacteroidota bacterium]